MAVLCLSCGVPKQDKRHHRFCRGCQKALLARGLCKWCGQRPRWHGRHSCEECYRGDWQDPEHALPPPEPAEVLPDPPVPKYRGPDARENVHETKHG